MSSSRALRAIFVGVLLLEGAAPFWAGRFLPLLDQPQQLALASILDRHADPGAGFADYFWIEVGITPYWGYLAPVWLLSRVLSVELATRILYTLWAIALPLSVAALLRALGRDWRWAAFTLPLVWNVHVFKGFASYLVSMPLFFFALAESANWLGRESPERGTALRTALLSMALFLAHGETFLLFGVVAAVWMAIDWRGVRWALRRAVAYFPAAVLFLAWAARHFIGGAWAISPQHAMHHPRYGRLGDAEGYRWEHPGDTIGHLGERIWGGYNDGSDHLVGAAWVVLVVLAVIFARGSGPPAGSGRELLRSRRGEIASALILAGYLFGPEEVGGQLQINTRVLIFAALLVPAFFTEAVAAGRRWLVAAVVALALLADLNAAWKIALFQPRAAPIEAVLARSEPGKRLLGLVFDRGDRDLFRFSPYLHFPAYYQVFRGGDVGFSFAGLPGVPVRYRSGAQAVHPSEWRPEEFDWETMAGSYDYFLVGGEPRGGAIVVQARAELVAEMPPWKLYRNRDGRSAASRREPG